MALAIERRLKRGMFSYLLTSARYFEDIGRYESAAGDFYDLLLEFLPEDWKPNRDGIWLKVVPPEDRSPQQGFKVHISAISAYGATTLRAVVPLCVEQGLAFKVVANDTLLDFLNSKNGPRSSSGKFITIYLPDTATGAELLPRLARAVGHLAAPYVLTDRRFGKARTVFYRYGGIRPRYELNLFGEKIPLLQLSDGTTVPDERAPVFLLPPGVEDPFRYLVEEDSTVEQGSGLLGKRYKVLSALQFSNTGGVYLARDTQTGVQIVLKEARPSTQRLRGSASDAVALLAKEARVLQRLQETGWVPRFLDFFQHWEHSFLALEYLDGQPLSSYRAMDDVGLLVQRVLTPERLMGFCQRFSTLGLQLLEVLQAFHRRGVVVGDLSPANVMVDLDDLSVRLLDFEGASLDGEELAASGSLVTAGFVSPARMAGGKPLAVDDFYSLGAVLYSLIFPVQAFFVLHPPALWPMFRALEEDLHLPLAIGRSIAALMDGDDREAEQQLSELSRITAEQLADWQPVSASAPAAEGQQKAAQVVEGIESHLMACLDLKRRDRLWPADYRVFTTNSLNLAYGAVGIATFLQMCSGQLPDGVGHWIKQADISTQSYPPGLFIGSAGVAWALWELGFQDWALNIMEQVWESPLRSRGSDLFYGVAGCGLAELKFWQATGDKRFLNRAMAAAATLQESAVEAPEGLYWPNVDGVHYYGYGHGGSGIAFFLLRLFESSGDQAALDLGRRALGYEMSRAVRQEGHAAWWRAAEHPLLSPYWRYGAAGVGSVLIRYHAVLGGDDYLRLAQEAARYAAAKYTVFPGQLSGLAGMGEFLLDMARLTGEEHYLHEAWKLAEGIFLFRVETEQGIAFPGEELVRLSTDYATGSAGIGMFLRRLLSPGPRFLFEFDQTLQVEPEVGV